LRFPPRDCGGNGCFEMLQHVVQLISSCSFEATPSSSGLWVSSRTHNPEDGDGTFLQNVREHRRNLRGARGQMPLFIFFLPQNNSFWLQRWKERIIKEEKYFLKYYLFCVKTEKKEKKLRFTGRGIETSLICPPPSPTVTKSVISQVRPIAGSNYPPHTPQQTWRLNSLTWQQVCS